MARAIISEATPAATPAMEIAVITPMKACRRLARKYREATKSSNLMEAFSRQLSALSLFRIIASSDRNDGGHGFAIRPVFLAETFFQFGVFHADHNRSGHDCECRERVAHKQAGSH